MRTVTRTKSRLFRAYVRRLTHAEACRIAQAVLFTRLPKVISIDLSDVEQITTSAFARLVLLRRELMSRGRDLRLYGMHGQGARLYEIERLERVLPRDNSQRSLNDSCACHTLHAVR